MHLIPDEFALSGTASIADVDDAIQYESRRGFDPTDEVQLLTTLGLTERDGLVEFGSGTGAFSIAVAGVAGRVIAVDPSDAMCRLLRRRASEAGVAVEVVHAGLLSYEHSGESPRFVFTKNTLHQLPDAWKLYALVRIRDLLPRGGLLRLRDLVYTFDPRDAQDRLTAWVESATEEGWPADELADHVRDEFSTYDFLLEAMLERAGFQVVDAEKPDVGVFASYTCRAV